MHSDSNNVIILSIIKKKITCEELTLVRGGCFFQHYIVDAYCFIEDEKLYYIRNNIRAELYNGLRDAVLEVTLTQHLLVIELVTTNTHRRTKGYV